MGTTRYWIKVGFTQVRPPSAGLVTPNQANSNVPGQPTMPTASYFASVEVFDVPGSDEFEEAGRRMQKCMVSTQQGLDNPDHIYMADQTFRALVEEFKGEGREIMMDGGGLGTHNNDRRQMLWRYEDWDAGEDADVEAEPGDELEYGA